MKSSAVKKLVQETSLNSLISENYSVYRLENDLILEPKIPQKSTLLWMHGLGDSPNGFLDFFLHFTTMSFIATKVILPMAQISPVTINGGMAMPSWYDITGFDRAATDFKKMQSDVETSSKRLIKILEAEKEITDQIFVGGFSQGCAMSFYLGSQLPFIKGIIGLSGYIFPFIPSITQPSFFAHGDLDPLIPLSMAQASAQGKFKGSFNFHIMKGLGHGVDEEEMLLMGKWFEENTGGKGKGEL